MPNKHLSTAESSGIARRLNKGKSPLAISPLKGGPEPFRICQFLYGEPYKRDFCGEPVVKGSYCPEHYELCHTRGGASDFWKKRKHWRGKT